MGTKFEKQIRKSNDQWWNQIYNPIRNNQCKYKKLQIKEEGLNPKTNKLIGWYDFSHGQHMILERKKGKKKKPILVKPCWTTKYMRNPRRKRTLRRIKWRGGSAITITRVSRTCHPKLTEHWHANFFGFFLQNQKRL